MMRLINRSKQSPIGRRACDAALAAAPRKIWQLRQAEAPDKLHR